ncbi:MAG: hypothetical protein ACK5LN_03275 [Propioniciclava sp.]
MTTPEPSPDAESPSSPPEVPERTRSPVEPMTDLLSPMPTGYLVGPLRTITWAVALGWLGLAAFGFWRLGYPWGWVLGGLGILAGLVTSWLGFTMRVRWDGAGIYLPTAGKVSWDQVDRVSLRRGLVTVPQVDIRDGRALQTFPLESLAWFGTSGAARALAQRIANLAEAGPVQVLDRARVASRRSRRSK